MWICKHCKKEFEILSPSEKANHSRWCEENPKRENYLKILENIRNNISKKSRKKQANSLKKAWKKGKYDNVNNPGFSGKNHSFETRKKISETKIKWMKENPKKHIWNTSKNKSKPCELLKFQLRKLGINYIEEYQPLFPQRYFSIDLAFPNKKIGIEINGNQHYNKNGTLQKYYQDRHNLIEKSGWKIYEFHFSKVYDNSIIEKIQNILKRGNIKENFNYNFWITNKMKREKNQYNKERIKKEKIERKIKKLLNSNINFSKFGWVTKAAKMLNITDQNVNRWMKRNMIEFYNKKCFKRKAPIIEIVS